jgi:hypothetical protein
MPSWAFAHISRDDYTTTHWYNPNSGLIIISETDSTGGATRYDLHSVEFPEGTTTHTLTPSSTARIAETASTDASTKTLTEAEYKGLPEGTKVRFQIDNDIKQLTVTRDEGFEFSYKVGGRWETRFALFGKLGKNQYSPQSDEGANYEADFDDASEAALAGLWPLKVGNSAVVRFREIKDDWGQYSSWVVEFQIVRREPIQLNGKTYASYVIREHAVRESKSSRGTNEYTATHWYNPGSGLILKRETLGDPREFLYGLISVTFPEGTTTHALTPVAGAQVAASQSELAEIAAKLKQQREEAEAQRAAQEQALAELERKRQEQEKALAELKQLLAQCLGARS